jgi:NAD(P)-dependent dehydrogenase (short-subunit alcohol dehydrogenase family)
MDKDLFDLSGKVALVTGGSRGLGLEVVRAFARYGADLIIASRRFDACEDAAREVEALGRRALPVSAHCGRWQEIDALVEAAYGAFGRVDILVNNAGKGPRQASDAVSEAAFDSVLGLNFKGAFRLAAQIARRMADGNGGAIINMSSAAASMPMPETAVYGCAKAALNAMTLTFAREYAPKVRVNAIAAGPFLTDVAKAWSEDARQRADNALGRPGRSHEIVTSALYLASDASSFTTGAVLRVDGGW